MKSFLLTLAAVCCVFALEAQEVIVGKPVQLMKGVEGATYYPVLSKDGKQMLFSGSNYDGLKVYSFDDQSVLTLTDAPYAGFEPVFNADGSVLYSTRSINSLGKKEVNVYKSNISDRKSELYHSGKTMAEALSAMHNVKVGSVLKSTNNISISAYTQGSTVYVCRNGKETAFSPVESYAGYIWASVSPDNSKVMFFAAGKGIVIMSVDGKVLSMLGNYEAPVWYGNDYVIAQNATDDGHNYSSSQIVLLKADGSMVKELTSPMSFAMFPSASIEAGRVVYNTIDGRMFMMNLTIK